MLKTLIPGTIAPPFSAYSHAVEIPAGARLLYISGQLGITPDGTVPDDFAGQADQAFRNVVAILEAAGMRPSDLVRVNTFLTDSADIPGYRAIRDRHLGGHEAASTMIVVSALAQPQFRIEVEAVAAEG
ncbi:MAG: RidA family protein [Rhodospirillales bacterium]|nr:MAG: RidA family protein [Rhodospirillales bacterium]